MMGEIPKDIKRLLFAGGAKQIVVNAICCIVTGSACLIVGIVGDAANKKLGLEPTSWFIIAVGFTIAALWHWLRAYYAAKEG